MEKMTENWLEIILLNYKKIQFKYGVFMTFSREDIYAPAESGGEVFKELMILLEKNSNNQSLTKTIVEKKLETIDDVVAKYREETGLDNVLSDKEEQHKKIASFKSTKYISIRHKKASESLTLIEKHPEIIKDIESICIHSGGTKSLHSIINYLQEKLGKENISHSDENLIKFIEKKLNEHKEDECNTNFEAGKIGLENENNPIDTIADYANNAAK